MFKKPLFVFLLTLVISLSLASVAFAAYGLEETAGAAGLNTSTKLPVLIGNVIGTALSLIGVIFFTLMIYGGFLWMTAHGKEEQAKQGLETVIAAIIGLIIILAAYTITSFVFGSVGGVGMGGQDEETPKNACTSKGSGFDCRDKNNGECDKNTIKTGLCPGGANIVCCQAVVKNFCDNSSECAANEECQSSKCVISTTCEVPCTVSGTQCDEQIKQCRYVDGQSCVTDASCMTGSTCANNVCKKLVPWGSCTLVDNSEISACSIKTSSDCDIYAAQYPTAKKTWVEGDICPIVQ